MKLFVLFVQRRESFPGEIGPEAVEICDEFTMDESPTWLEKERNAYLSKKSEFVAAEIVEISLSPMSVMLIQDRLTGRLQITGHVAE